MSVAAWRRDGAAGSTKGPIAALQERQRREEEHRPAPRPVKITHVLLSSAESLALGAVGAQCYEGAGRGRCTVVRQASERIADGRVHPEVCPPKGVLTRREYLSGELED
ncbi:MAG TPA: hypothetical protein VGN26_12495 [Armatimonadota bacterium]|jgi:hypothetical protein